MDGIAATVVWLPPLLISYPKANRCAKMSIITETAGVITAATALVGIGIGVGKVLLGLAFLKGEVKEIRTRLTAVEKEQIKIKNSQFKTQIVLRQIAKKLKIIY